MIQRTVYVQHYDLEHIFASLQNMSSEGQVPFVDTILVTTTLIYPVMCRYLIYTQI